VTHDGQQSTTRLAFGSVLLLALLIGGLLLGWLAGPAWASSAAMAITELALAVLVVVAAGGYGFLLVRPIAPKTVSTLFRALTASAIGLWMLSTCVLIVGSAVAGSLTPWVWWPVVAVGLALAGWQGRKAVMAWDLPRKADSGVLLWLIIGLVVAVWLAGAVRPPGYVGRALADHYDVLEYHLQVPREFFDAGGIGQLKHNCYSYYPLGVEMLFLLGMCLRGGAYEGMYLAQMLHGIFGVLACAGVYAALKTQDLPRAKFSVGLLASTPIALYLGSMAMVELAQVCYLTFALLWLRRWLREGSARSAALVGLMLGAACATKYLAVAMVAGPVIVAMLALAAIDRRRLVHVPLAALMALLPFAPWLVRNAAYTGNPVFPLATGALGRAHWSAESQRRWSHGHGPETRPPVPVPPGWRPSVHRTRPDRLLYDMLLSERFGQIAMVLVAAGICVLFASRGPPDRWEWSLAGVLVLQVLAWTFLTHQMPARFVVPAIVPIALLAGGALGRFSRVEVNPFHREAIRPAHGPWGMAPAGAIFIFAVAINLYVAANTLRIDGYGRPIPPIPPLAGSTIIKVPPYDQAAGLPAGSRILLVGDSRGFYFPPGTLYATAFDPHPLADMLRRGLTGEKLIGELRAMEVTHVWVNWREIWRLAATYGYPAVLSRELHDRWQAMRGPGLAALDQLTQLGAKSRQLRYPFRATSQPASRPASQTATAPAPKPPESKQLDRSGFPRHWPTITIYALPPVDGIQ